MRVLCLVPYPTLGASNRLRIEQYAPRLRAMGIELTISPFLDEATYAILYRQGHVASKSAGVLRGMLRRLGDLRRSGDHDVVLVHREAAPIGPPFVERVLRSMGRAVVYDFDDAIFLPAIHPANRRWAWLRTGGRVAETVRLADEVVAGNEYLASWARDHSSAVTVIPTPVDTERHRPREAPLPPGPVVIGWVGSSTTAPYLRMLDVPLARLGQRRSIAVRVVGGTYANPAVPVAEVPYSLEAEPREIARFDIGVLPEPDDPWTRGKGALKARLYMATGLPVVASRVGVNPDVVLDGITGYCVEGDEAWTEALERLAADGELRARMGAAGRRAVEERWSVAVQAPRLAEVIRRAASRHNGHR